MSSICILELSFILLYHYLFANTYMVKIYCFIITAILIMLASDVQAQTFRISCGENAEGHQIYKEIYEYDYVSEKPMFPGGEHKLLKFINNTREYPQKAYEANIQGRVICSFIVDCDGSIKYIQILKGVEESLNQEAIRIIQKMPDWIPGRIDGQVIPVRVVYPIAFRK